MIPYLAIPAFIVGLFVVLILVGLYVFGWGTFFPPVSA